MDGRIRIAIVENPYTGNRPELPGHGIEFEFSDGPGIISGGGLLERLESLGCNLVRRSTVQLELREEQLYGTWYKLGHALGYLREFVTDNQKNNCFTIGLHATCNSLTGMLAGLQHSAGWEPLRVGLVWIDSHGDFNTPESSVSGLLGEMPVAVSSGLCLHRLRLQAGLDPPLPTRYITMAGLRKIYRFERELLDRSDIEFLSVDDLRTLSDKIDHQMKRLCHLVDIVCIHVDMDVLDPAELPGTGFPEPDGPTSTELSAVLTLMLRYKKVAALGIASTPYKKDKDRIALNATYRLIEGAIRGIQER